MTATIEIPEKPLSDKEITPFTALCFTTFTTLATLSEWNHVVGELYIEAARLGLTPAGPIQYVYVGVTGDAYNEFQLDIALPIVVPAESAGTFSYKTFAEFRCAAYTHTGAWADLSAVYDALFGQLYGSGHRNDGHIREVYAYINKNQPETCVTEIQIGLA